MTKVKRYHLTETGLVEGESLGRLSVVLAADFDAAVDHVAQLERLLANAYETAAMWVEKRCDAYVGEHGSNDPETGAVEFPGDGEEYVGELMEIADGLRALKTAWPAKCERCECSTVETCDERGCGYLGAGNGAPE